MVGRLKLLQCNKIAAVDVGFYGGVRLQSFKAFSIGRNCHGLERRHPVLHEVFQLWQLVVQ